MHLLVPIKHFYAEEDGVAGVCRWECERVGKLVRGENRGAKIDATISGVQARHESPPVFCQLS